jgi:hypothetical protein
LVGEYGDIHAHEKVLKFFEVRSGIDDQEDGDGEATDIEGREKNIGLTKRTAPRQQCQGDGKDDQCGIERGPVITKTQGDADGDDLGKGKGEQGITAQDDQRASGPGGDGNSARDRERGPEKGDHLAIVFKGHHGAP